MGGGIGGGGGSGGGESRSRAAVEATRRGPGIKRLTIRAAEVGGATGRRVELRVADTGPGIPAEVLPRIFDPFFSTKRGARPAKETVPAAAAEACGAADGSEECVPRGGTGLGLTICQELIAAAGGAIRAESEPGKGATFVIELPLAAGGDEKAAGASST
jgi:signal transduction histidine kinase